jgi:hypothetical protein
MRRRFSFIGIVAIVAVVGLYGTSPLLGQSQEELAKQLSNPVAALISLPLQ